MKLSSFETIIDEKKFVSINETRANGPPDSWETQAAKDRLKKYHQAKESLIPDEIKQIINQTIEQNGVHHQESTCQELNP